MHVSDRVAVGLLTARLRELHARLQAAEAENARMRERDRDWSEAVLAQLRMKNTAEAKLYLAERTLQAYAGGGLVPGMQPPDDDGVTIGLRQ